MFSAFRRSLLVLLLAPVLAACASAAREPAAPTAPVAITAMPLPQRGSGGVLRLIYWDAPTILNPHLAPGSKDWEASRLTYEPLASFNKDQQLIPFLAAEIPSLENGGLAADFTSVIWKLKSEVQWSDGVLFTADDVVFTYAFITNPPVASPSAGAYAAIKDIAAIDDYTVKITFKGPNPSWALPFVGVNGMILPRHMFKAYNGPNARSAPANMRPVGTGPYQVVDFKPQEVLFLGNQLVETKKVVYEPNPFFREADKPFFRRVELRGGGTVGEAARSVLEDGWADYAWNLQLPGETLTALAAAGKGQVIINFGSWVEQIALNRTNPNAETADGERSSLQFPHPFFSDKRVRQAFAHAIDRKAIAALYGPAGQLTSNYLVAPEIYNSSDTSGLYDFDLQQAAALLDEAGWVDTDGDGIRDKDGIRMRVLFKAPDSPVIQQTQRIIQQALGSIQVAVEVKIINVSTFYGADLTNPDSGILFYADLQEFSIAGNSPDPSTYMQYLTCAQIPQKANNWSAGLNIARWCNPEYDALYAQSTTEIDPEKRRQLFIQMNDLLIEDVELIPLLHLAQVSAVSNSLVGVEPTPWDVDVWNIKDWRRISP